MPAGWTCMQCMPWLPLPRGRAVTPARADASQTMGRGFTCMRACMQDILVCARWVVLLRVGGDHRDPGEALQRRLPARRQRTLRQVPPVCAPPSLHLLRMRRTPAHMSAHTRVVATRGVGCDDSSHPKLARATARRMATAIARPVISAACCQESPDALGRHRG